MNKKTECTLVQDLLPNHLDNLTSDETNEFIERHIQQCEDCYQLKRTLQRPFSPEEQAKAELIDFLRRTRIRRRRRWRLLVGLTLLTAALLLLPWPCGIDRMVTATLWNGGLPENSSQTIPLHVQGTYFNYLLRTDRFEGTIISPDMEFFPGNAALTVHLDDAGLISVTDAEGFAHIKGFMYAETAMQDFFICLYDENGRWSGRGGLVLTANAANREEAVQTTRQVVKNVRCKWLLDSNWEGSPTYTDFGGSHDLPDS